MAICCLGWWLLRIGLPGNAALLTVLAGCILQLHTVVLMPVTSLLCRSSVLVQAQAFWIAEPITGTYGAAGLVGPAEICSQ